MVPEPQRKLKTHTRPRSIFEAWLYTADRADGPTAHTHKIMFRLELQTIKGSHTFSLV